LDVWGWRYIHDGEVWVAFDALRDGSFQFPFLPTVASHFQQSVYILLIEVVPVYNQDGV